MAKQRLLSELNDSDLEIFRSILVFLIRRYWLF